MKRWDSHWVFAKPANDSGGPTENLEAQRMATEDEKVKYLVLTINM